MFQHVTEAIFNFLLLLLDKNVISFRVHFSYPCIIFYICLYLILLCIAAFFCHPFVFWRIASIFFLIKLDFSSSSLCFSPEALLKIISWLLSDTIPVICTCYYLFLSSFHIWTIFFLWFYPTSVFSIFSSGSYAFCMDIVFRSICWKLSTKFCKLLRSYSCWILIIFYRVLLVWEN